MRKRLLLNDQGMSLVTVLMTFSIFTIAMGSMLTYAAQKRKIAERMNLSATANLVKQKLVGLVLAPQSWQVTQARNSTVFATFNPASPAILDIFSVDATTPYYQASHPWAGFDMKGRPCMGFTPSGNDLCPLRYEITLKNRTFQNGNWIDTLHFELLFRPAKGLALKTSSEEFSFDLVRNLNDQSAESACIAVRGVYNAKSNACTVKLTESVSPCANNQTYRGPALNGGASRCDNRTIASTSCANGKVVKGFDANGTPLCGAPL